jgi:hypothetical protein
VLVAGVDVGNSTTEVAVARCEPGREPEFLLVLREPTTGSKGSLACRDGVAALVDRAERRLGERPHLLLLADLHAVETGLLELGRLEEVDLAQAAIARPASATPSGAGVAAGRLRSLDGLAGPPEPGPVVAVIGDVDFEVAAAQLREARARGWTITAAIVEHDDAVLIGNRFDRDIPIVDEVADAASLPLGELAAVEVAEPGTSVEHASDPLRLAVLLGLGPADARTARYAARAVAGHRAAIVVRMPARAQATAVAQQAPVRLLAADGTARPLDERAPVPPPGEIVGLRGAAGDRDGLLDVSWCPLPAPAEDPGFARRLARRRAVAIATLVSGGGDGLLEALAELTAGGAEVVARESHAAVLGASTTPGAGFAPFVLDLGGGTVDLHREQGGEPQMVATAGAGDLVTRVCAALLGCDRRLAERAKRRPSVRPETPFVLHHEDGSRSFRGEPVSPVAVARLCVDEGKALVPLEAGLAPEVWRGLRRAAKRDVIARNVRRALEAAGGAPRGELVTLVGGSACDGEVVDVVAAELADRDLAVARGDVLGRHGPRAAVAVGLVLAFARR